MTQLSPSFTLAELTATATGLPNVPTPRQVDRLRHLAACLEKVKAGPLQGMPVIVSSGFRSDAVNKAVGGSPTSDHRNGDAADIKCPKFGTPLQVAQAIVKAGIEFDQLILEPTWVHFGVGPRMRGEKLTKRRGSNVYEKGINP